MAYYVNGDRNPFYMMDLPSDPEDFTYCSVGINIFFTYGIYVKIFLYNKSSKKATATFFKTSSQMLRLFWRW